MYEKAVFERSILTNEDMKQKMTNRTLFGHAEHPDKSQSDLQLTSHIITDTLIRPATAVEIKEMGIPEGSEVAFQQIDVLDTPCGRIVNTLLEAECAVGVSTRAEGDLEEREDKDSGKKYMRVIPEAYRYITTDFTADPSTYGTRPMSVVREIKNEIESGKLTSEEKVFATAILEAIEKAETKKGVKEDITPEEEPTKEEPEDEEDDIDDDTEKHPVWQGLMDSAYDKWEKGMNKADFLESLDSPEAEAVVLGNLNYQVQNGGFYQWIDNGYAELSASDVLFVLKRMKTPAARAVIKMVRQVIEYMDSGAFGDDGEEHDEEALDALDKLDDEYYVLDDQFNNDIEKYLTGLSQRKKTDESQIPDDKDNDETKIKKLTESAEERWKKYMQARWPEKDLDEPYSQQWLDRFKKGTEWERADSEGRSILQKTFPGAYPKNIYAIRESTIEDYIEKELIKLGVLAEYRGKKGKVTEIKEHTVTVTLDNGATAVVAGPTPVGVNVNGDVLILNSCPGCTTVAEPEMAGPSPEMPDVSGGASDEPSEPDVPEEVDSDPDLEDEPEVEEEAQDSEENNKPFESRQRGKTRIKESSLSVKEIDFSTFKEKVQGEEGIVCLGAGGDPQEWIDGISGIWNDEGIGQGTAEDFISDAFLLTTSGGRTDLVLVFKEDAKLSMGKLAMWRLRFGDCSWISDYLVNYAKQHGQASDIEEEDLPFESRCYAKRRKGTAQRESITESKKNFGSRLNRLFEARNIVKEFWDFVAGNKTSSPDDAIKKFAKKTGYKEDEIRKACSFTRTSSDESISEGFSTDLKNRDKKAVKSKMNAILDKLLKGERLTRSEKAYQDAFNKAVNKNVKEKKFVFESYDELVDYLKDKFTTLSPEQVTKLSAVFPTAKLNESTVPVQETRTLKLKEAATRAELETALEMLTETEDKIKNLQYTMKIESSVLGKKLQESKAVESKELLALKSLLETKMKELRDLKKAHEHQISESKTVQESYDAKVKVLKEDCQTKVIKQYIDLKEKSSSLSLPSNSRALLEKCTSTEEVDKVFETVRDVLRRGALLPSESGNVTVQVPENKTSEAVAISEKVKIALDGMFTT
jgi:hypothetical protein